MSLCSRALVVAFVFFTVATAHVSAALGPSPLNPCPESLFRVSSSHFGAAVAALLVKNAASFILQAILPSNKDPQQQQEEENQKDSSVASPSQAAAPSVLVLNRHHQLMQDRETQLRTPPCSSPLRISALQNLFKLTKALHSNRPSHPFVREDRTPKDLTTFCRAL